MFAIGHLSLAYLLGKASSKLLKVNPNMPALLFMSMLPDIDMAIGTLTSTSMHHGPTHSMIFALLFFMSFFIIYGKRASPYFIAYVSHFLLGDFFIGGQLQLFWPMSSNNFGFHQSGFSYMGLNDPMNIAVELSLLVVAIMIMAKTQDYKMFLKNDKTNILLLVPMVTLLMSTFTNYPFTKPLFLVLPIMGLPHLCLLVFFSMPMLMIIYTTLKKVLT